MPVYAEQKKILKNDLVEEQVKQIGLNLFFSFFVRRDIEDVMKDIADNVQFIGTREHYVAHDKEEFYHIWKREMDFIPADCVVKVIFTEASEVSSGCYSVKGDLEVRIPYKTRIEYENLRFSMTVLQALGRFQIATLHTALFGGEQDISPWKDVQIHNMAENMKESDKCDVLTGMYMLDAFKKELGTFLGKAAKDVGYALLCTGVEHYERVNNLYGLKRADEMLVELAGILTTSSKAVKLCCRSVADHFIMLVEYQELNRLKQMMNSVCEEFDRRIAGRFSEAGPKLGIGVYLITGKEENVGEMVENANIARKSLQVKRGIRIAFYDAEIFQRMEKVRSIERSMKDALDDREFTVFFQPKYDLVSGNIVGAEALCRWIRVDGTMIYPDEFIPVFEKNGSIVKLDLYMLSEACRMMERRRKSGKYCVPVSINQSRVLLEDDKYVEKIASVLAKYNTPSHLIELELTERIFRDNLSDIGKVMGRLKNLGIRWSIDDFGTGYSSLNLLKKLPVDIIKIDKSFLDETETSETSKIIIRKTVELTQELNKKVVCEGVETESQADYLRGVSCDIAQGYLYAKPMSMDEFEKLLDKEM